MLKRRILVNALAVIGGLAVLSMSREVVEELLMHNYMRVMVLGPGDAPAVSAPIFLDRGTSAIERYASDSAGFVRLPLKRYELQRAVWLICVPGGYPMVGHKQERQYGTHSYGFTAYPSSSPVTIRASGWRGPIPRECPQLVDSLGWRYPASAGRSPSAITYTEPQWREY